jgi:hypothetical protein
MSPPQLPPGCKSAFAVGDIRAQALPGSAGFQGGRPPGPVSPISNRQNIVSTITSERSRGLQAGFPFSVVPIVVGLTCSLPPLHAATNALPPASTNHIDFTRDIKPIFGSCLRCHGPEKPKSGFRLTSREAALKGGDNGVDVIPGDSAKSPLIHYVARLPEVEDMWMPPSGKGDPLTAAEVSLLRAWIDQGIPWETTAPPPKVEMALTPTFGWSTVSGNEHVFREHQWLREGWSGGVEHFRLRDRLTENTFLTAEGHALADDYNVGLLLERTELGFVRAGVARYRKFFSDSGGRYQPFEPDIFRLDKDLHLNIGRAWADVGFTVPDLPRVVIGYEYQYREGDKSTLQWGPVTQTVPGAGTVTRNIYPAFKYIDEQVHIIKLDASYNIAGFELENRFRGEFYDLDTDRTNARGLDRSTGQLRPGVFEEIQEGQTHFEGANTFRVEKQFRDWLFGSAGYHFARLEADAFFDLDWNYVTGPPGFRQNWSTPEIVLDREVHAGSISTLLGPWAGLTASAGLQAEYSEQDGIGSAVVETGFGPFPPFVATNQMSSDLTRKVLQESLVLRYTTIPFTVLFGEARLQQESIDQSEDQESIAGPVPQQLFSRDTEASSDLKDFRGGFTTSPWRRISLTAHYRRYEKDSYYDHVKDVYFGGEGFGYPAFIQRRKIVSDEIEPKLVWQALPWLKTSLTYKLVASDFHTGTDSLRVGSTVFTDDKRIYAANYDAHVYSVNFALTPWRRVYLSSTFSFQDTRTAASVPDTGAVVPYKGHVYSAITSGNLALTEKNDLQISYSFSHADYGQGNETEGLPLGIVYQQHGAQIGLTRRIAKSIAANLRYGFFLYDEPTSSGVNDYTAHLLFGTVVVRFP